MQNGPYNPIRTRGFTLLELVAVMVVLAIAFAAATPMLGGFVRGRQADDTAVQLLAVAQWARQRAVLEARPYRLTLNPEAGRYRLHAQDPGGQFGAVPHDFGQAFTAPNGVTVEWADLDIDSDRGQDGVMFWPDGTVEPVAIRVRSAAGEAWLVACQSPSEPFTLSAAAEETWP